MDTGEYWTDLTKIPLHTMYAKLENINQFAWCTSDTTSEWENVVLSSSQLASTDMIGKYVDYKPAGSNYTVAGGLSGTNSDQVLYANNNMMWRIWGVNGNKLLLISETTAGTMKLHGAQGYNNGVGLLNESCSVAFGNSSTYGSGVINARSINQDDIDKVTNMTTDTQRKAVDSSYGSRVSPSGGTYPTLYAYEPGKGTRWN